MPGTKTAIEPGAAHAAAAPGSFWFSLKRSKPAVSRALVLGYFFTEASEDGGHEMWGEGASDLWGRLERDEDEREAEILEAIWSRLRESTDPGEDNSKRPPAGLKAAALHRRNGRERN
jgi:hypothetical protein